MQHLVFCFFSTVATFTCLVFFQTNLKPHSRFKTETMSTRRLQYICIHVHQ
jgi:hypothetical protein